MIRLNLFLPSLLTILLTIICTVSCSTRIVDIETDENAIFLIQDRTQLLRNPCMGWVIYDDAAKRVANAEEYWAKQDESARKYASILYVRWRWSDMEPEEGKYAWKYDQNYKDLIQGALDRGLKLAFRVYVNPTDNLFQATPNYVKEAIMTQEEEGKRGEYVPGQQNVDLWTPHVDSKVFQAKYRKFIEAFAAEYDNPDVVDYVDGYPLGHWGEGHGTILSPAGIENPNTMIEVFDEVTSMYADNFKKVQLLFSFASPTVGWENEKEIAIDGKGFGMRRDGVGGMWLTPERMAIAEERYGKTLLIGESSYFGSYTTAWQPFLEDYVYDLKSWTDAYTLSCYHAKTYHFNTLDLRGPVETEGRTTLTPELVWDYVLNGGYRVYPFSVSIPKSVKNGEKITISHAWRNTASGYLPNNMKCWNYKYKPAFALIDCDGNVVKSWVDDEAEPSDWLQNQKHRYAYTIALDGVEAGEYFWGVAIVDKTKDNLPGIKIAIKDKETIDSGWVLITKVSVNQ